MADSFYFTKVPVERYHLK